ncbi:hypothetical protein D9613_008742 [Agrocybe pediades]|uniref:DUF6533 domain-containing protein n=1 Tax=Agrocybe pediades TaxID=84607 RepID=A0A8H4QT66_9AGAR|nr:hypothetical protein D9613_008742 [Agrocybe pediades]
MVSSQHIRFLQFCIQYTSIALIFYDYFLTWTREIKYVWMKKFTLSTVFYIASRYSMVSNVLYLMAMARKLPKGLSCTNAYRICCAFSVLGRAAVVCVLCARTYAIYNRNKYILAILGPLGATIIIMDSVHVRWVVCVGDPDPRNKISEPFGFSLTFALLLVVYEVLASMLTFYRSWQALRIRDDLKDVTNKLEYLVVKEGVLYFSFVSIFTLSTLVMLTVSPALITPKSSHSSTGARIEWIIRPHVKLFDTPRIRADDRSFPPPSAGIRTQGDLHDN